MNEQTKLTEEVIKHIELIESAWTVVQLAKQLGISRVAMYGHIARGNVWAARIATEVGGDYYLIPLPEVDRVLNVAKGTDGRRRLSRIRKQNQTIAFGNSFKEEVNNTKETNNERL